MTRKRYPGKYEGASDDRVAEVLYNIDHDDEAGSVSENGTWYGLVLGSRPGKRSYIVTEDSDGFVDYEEYETADEANAAWDEIQEELSAYYDEGEEEDDDEDEDEDE